MRASSSWNRSRRSCRSGTSICSGAARFGNVVRSHRGLAPASRSWSSTHGPSGSGMLLRRVMRALAEALVVYTRGEAVALRSRGTRRLVVAAHNAIYSAREMTPASSASPHGFIYVGRLVKAKKPAILIDALARVRDELGEDARLAIVGD